ncbi:scopoletin glucosyltransferase-like [Dioscorea cayenensis subsp. rotundata]|uniref:Scopoletin glucosyltransferase-like n=1 Tax=Dioscorea cayennensis subsp. rotundata TaxID=55577 RepID=A0AB40CP87_DIOCR|nr:scopoletin glucosyltransferase-like [Dioscorea cayenensis subsp. rotundata]
MIPMLETARLFSENSVKTSIVTTPANANLINPLLHHHPSISLHLIPFPSTTFQPPFRLRKPHTSSLSTLANNFFSAVFSLRDPLSHLLSSLHPDAIISDALYTWTTELAGEVSIPSGYFPGHQSFPLSAANDLDLHRPYNSISDDSELFLDPRLSPHRPLDPFSTPGSLQLPPHARLAREAELSAMQSSSTLSPLLSLTTPFTTPTSLHVKSSSLAPSPSPASRRRRRRKQSHAWNG